MQDKQLLQGMAFTEGLRSVYSHQKLQFDEFVDFLTPRKCQGAKMYSCSGRRDSCSYVINCPVDSVKSTFGCSPLLYHSYWPISKFRDRSTKLLSRKNIASKFKDTEHKATFMPDLSGQSGGGTQAKELLI